MDEQITTRRVPIATSVLFGVVTIAVLVLWVRSYWRMDTVFLAEGPATLLASNNGYLVLHHVKGNQRLPHKGWLSSGTTNRHFGEWLYVNNSTDIYFSLPHWFVSGIFAISALACVTYSGLPMPNRFSLRTMLVATTLVAVVLGLGVWLAS